MLGLLGVLKGFRTAMTKVTERTGGLFGWLILPLTLLVMLEVIMRYVFNHPTVWVWDANIQLMAALGATGGAYALLHKDHVSVDVLVTRLSRRRRVILDALMHSLAILGVGLLLWRTAIEAHASVVMRESYVSMWAPPLYPLKIVVLFGIALLLLQLLADLSGFLVELLGPADAQESGK